jgi:adenylosuccinate synthase
LSTIHVVVGGQYGSEGKGAVTAHLCRTRHDIGTAIRVAGPNAGHSAVHRGTGKTWALRQIPVAAVVRNDNLRLVLAAGSEIDPEVLHDEIQRLQSAGIPIEDRLWISDSATVITPEMLEQEGGYGGALTQRLGSTAKGVGAARAERVWRRAPTWADHVEQDTAAPEGHPDIARQLRHWMTVRKESLIIEGTQGYALGFHGEHYPQCTSSDCRAIDFLSMAGLNPWEADDVRVWVCLRTYPIRVAGNSGRMHDETTWEALEHETDGYVQPEYTTVTRKLRRVGRWDTALAKAAVAANGRNKVRAAITFFDYWYPRLAGSTNWGDLTLDHRRRVHDLGRELQCKIGLLGTGPDSMIEVP